VFIIHCQSHCLDTEILQSTALVYSIFSLYRCYFDAHLVGWLQANWPECSETVEHTSHSVATGRSDVERCRTVILHFDHMRSRSSYSKTITNWMSELRITGRLVFYDRHIIALLQGIASQIKVCC